MRSVVGAHEVCLASTLAGGEEPSRGGRDPHRAGAGAEGRTVVDDVSMLILPLMHHFVKQRVERFGPSMATDVASANDDLGAVVGAARDAVVTEAALHAARHADGDGPELGREVPPVVLLVPAFELADEWRVVRVGMLPGSPNGQRALNGVGEDDASSRVAMRAGSTAGKGDDRSQHLGRRREERLVDPQLATAEAHHHGPVPRQPTGIKALQAEGAKPGVQLRRRPGRRGELEDELGGVVSRSAEKVAQRAKHCDAPGTNVLIFDDQTDVDTSICSGESVMTFSDDGRPPRERFETVPAVEITVPFLVCST